MTSAELKHRVKLQEWAARIQDCRSSGLSVRAWCRQEEINDNLCAQLEQCEYSAVRKSVNQAKEKIKKILKRGCSKREFLSD